MSDVIPEGWRIENIETIANVGSSKRILQSEYVPSGVPFFRSKEAIRRSKNLPIENPLYISKKRFKELKDKHGAPKKNEILVTAVGTIGVIYLIEDIEFYFKDGNLLWIKHIDEDVNPSYLAKYLASDTCHNAIIEIAGGSSQSALTIEKLSKLEFNLPPLPEQQKIAAILSRVDDVIEKTQAQINKLKDLKTGMMQELLSPREGQAANINNPQGESKNGLHHTEFKDSPLGRIPVGWEVEYFSDIFELKNGVNKGKEFFGNGVPIISYRNVYDRDGITDDKITGLVEMNESELSRFHSQHGDIFITRTSETPDEIGFANVYLGCRSDVVFSGFVIRARQITKVINPIYSLYAFQTHSIREQMIHNSKFTTRAGISGESLSRLKIAVPPIEEQTKIAEALTSITNRIDSLELKNKSTKSIKKALMQDLLTGKVRVQVDAA